MDDKYILDGRTPVKTDLLTWAKWFQSTDRRVAFDEVNDARVSTVFLGSDHGFGEGDEPLIFETMIFGGEHDQYCDRCGTWEGAEAMHAKALRLVAPLQ